jgi:hypothetical protein
MEAPYELFAKLSVAPLAEFGAAFDEFKGSAFRLECLPSYLVEEEAEHLGAYKSGGSCPPGMNAEWLQFLESARSKNRVVQRVRLVPKHREVLDYFGFEADWGYRESIRAGEKINLMPSANLVDYADHVPMLQDYWLFDDARCYLIFYDLLGRFLGTIRTPDAVAASYAALSKELWANSHTFDQEQNYTWKQST